MVIRVSVSKDHSLWTLITNQPTPRVFMDIGPQLAVDLFLLLPVLFLSVSTHLFSL